MPCQGLEDGRQGFIVLWKSSGQWLLSSDLLCSSSYIRGSYFSFFCRHNLQARCSSLSGGPAKAFCCWRGDGDRGEDALVGEGLRELSLRSQAVNYSRVYLCILLTLGCLPVIRSCGRIFSEPPEKTRFCDWIPSIVWTANKAAADIY